jgi:hypothetical protein
VAQPKNYEEVYLNAYVSVAEAKAGIGSWLSFYNEERQRIASVVVAHLSTSEDRSNEHRSTKGHTI